MSETAKSLLDVLAKKRRITLELAGRPHLTGLPLEVLGENLHLYQRTRLKKAHFVELPLALIEAVWDPQGACIWRNSEKTD
jgi:hypothetical protein